MKNRFFEYIPALSGNFYAAALLLVFYSAVYSGIRISGLVTDPESLPIEGVNISIFPEAGGTTTGPDGTFYFSRLKKGSYTLKFSHIAFEEKEIEIISGETDEKHVRLIMRPAEITLKEINVTAAALPAVTVETIGRGIIESGKAGTVEEVLRNSSAVKVTRTNGVSSNLSVRGSESGQVSVMMDGVIISSSMDGSFDLNSVPASIVERIDVYKGGDICLSNRAAGGIINIITKKNVPADQGSITARYSSKAYISDRDSGLPGRFNNNFYSLSLERPFAMKGREFSLVMSLDHRNQKNNWSYINAAKADEYRYIDNPNVPEEQTNSYYYSGNFFSSLSCRVSGILDTGYSFSLDSEKAGLPGWYDWPYYDAFTKGKSVRNRFNITAEPVRGTEIGADIYYDLGDRRVFIDETAEIFYTDNTDKFKNRGCRISFSADSLFERSNAAAGAEYSAESLVSEDLDGERDRNTLSVFLNAGRYVFEKNTGRRHLSARVFAGARLDNVSAGCSDGESHYLYSGGAVCEVPLSESWTLTPFVRYGTDYMLPSFSSLFWLDNAFSSGNPDLEPEFSETAEGRLSLSGETGSFILSAELELYDKKLKNLIVWEKKSTGKYIPQNMESGRIRGAGMSAEISFYGDLMKIKASADVLDTRTYTGDEATDRKKIIYKPGTVFSGSFVYKKSGHRVEYSVSYTGKMFMNTTNTIDTRPFWLSSVKYSYSYGSDGTFTVNPYISIENALDEQYQIVYGYPMPGRSVEAGISVTFGKHR